MGTLTGEAPGAGPTDAAGAAAIRVTLRCFAQYREALGTGRMELELPAGSRVADAVRRARELAKADTLPARPAVALNREYASLEERLADGDEVALVPPVAGG